MACSAILLSRETSGFWRNLEMHFYTCKISRATPAPIFILLKIVRILMNPNLIICVYICLSVSPSIFLYSTVAIENAENLIAWIFRQNWKLDLLVHKYTANKLKKERERGKFELIQCEKCS